MKKYQMNLRIDEEVNEIVQDVMAEKECNKSEAVRIMAKTYKDNAHNLSLNQKLIFSVFICEMENEINKLSNNQGKEISKVLEEFKCQIL